MVNPPQLGRRPGRQVHASQLVEFRKRLIPPASRSLVERPAVLQVQAPAGIELKRRVHILLHPLRVCCPGGMWNRSSTRDGWPA